MERKQREFLAELCEANPLSGKFRREIFRLEQGALFPLGARKDEEKGEERDILVVGMRPNGKTTTIDTDKAWHRVILLRWATQEEKNEDGIMAGIPAECLELLIFDQRKNFFRRSGIRSECYIPG